MVRASHHVTSLLNLELKQPKTIVIILVKLPNVYFGMDLVTVTLNVHSLSRREQKHRAISAIILVQTQNICSGMAPVERAATYLSHQESHMETDIVTILVIQLRLYTGTVCVQETVHLLLYLRLKVTQW